MIDRRTLLEALLGLLLAPAALARAQSSPERAAVDPALGRALAESPYVYVSPLRSNGEESRCHGEVWYGWVDGSVVMITAAKSWKARSLARGLTRARIWVGDYGRVQKLIGSNQAFRAGPSFLARAERVRDCRDDRSPARQSTTGSIPPRSRAGGTACAPGSPTAAGS